MTLLSQADLATLALIVTALYAAHRYGGALTPLAHTALPQSNANPDRNPGPPR